jgi:hypothetical protein
MVNPMRSPDEVIEHLEKHKILIGPKYPVLNKYIRVSPGTPAKCKLSGVSGTSCRQPAKWSRSAGLTKSLSVSES